MFCHFIVSSRAARLRYWTFVRVLLCRAVTRGDLYENETYKGVCGRSSLSNVVLYENVNESVVWPLANKLIAYENVQDYSQCSLKKAFTENGSYVHIIEPLHVKDGSGKVFQCVVLQIPARGRKN